jgi:hypothetical protein
MEEILLSKVITLEVIVETLLEELFSNNIIDRNKFDEAVLIKIKKLEKQFKEIEKEDIDYSKLFKGPIGEA